MIEFGRIRERFGKTAGVAKLSDVFQFQGTSPDSLEDKWLRWQQLMKQMNMTSLGDDARETLTLAGLEKAKERALGTTLASTCSTNLDSVVCKCLNKDKERALGQHLRLRAPQTWTVLCASV